MRNARKREIIFFNQAHETGINASLTIGSFFRIVVSASSKEIKEPSLDHFSFISRIACDGTKNPHLTS